MKNCNEIYNQFIGSEKIHKYFENFYLTDGALEIANNEACFWFYDVILSTQILPKVAREEFQVWTLERIENTNSFNVKATDGGTWDEAEQKEIEKTIYLQKIEFSDFECDTYKLYFENSTLCLPRER